jgi:hypothetical protein
MPKDKPVDPPAGETDTSAPSPADAAPATVDLEWNGETWTVPSSPNDWDFDTALALEQGKALTFLHGVLGPAQMARFRRGGRTKASDAAGLFNQVVEATGGKSPGE